jgi:hypothetical protein
MEGHWNSVQSRFRGIKNEEEMKISALFSFINCYENALDYLPTTRIINIFYNKLTSKMHDHHHCDDLSILRRIY